MKLFVAILFLTGLAHAQDDPLLAVGREFVAKLKLEQAADEKLFRDAGLDQAQKMLEAVMGRGQSLNATPPEWTEMHRALAGLIELYTAKGEIFKAALFANFQDIYYRNDEGDYEAALTAARLSLELQQKSGQSTTLYICWKNIGEDLIKLGRLDEGMEALYQAHRLIDNPVSSVAAIIWNAIVEGEIARRNPAAARRECDAFVKQAEASAPALFRGRALLARAGMEIEESRFDEALNSARAALQAMAGDKDALTFGYECANQLMTMVLAAMDYLPYEQSLELAGRMDREFADLAFPVAPYARKAIEHRRRLAGEFDVLLREDTAELEKARAAKDVHAQIALLRSLGVTYSWANNAQQQIALLEEAMALEKSLLPASGIPADATSQYYYFGLMASLGTAYAAHEDIGNARKCFEDVARGIDALPAGMAKTRLAKQYAQALLGQARVAEMAGDANTARQILQDALHAPANGPAKFLRSEVLLQAARLERNLNQQPLEAVRYYEESIQALHAEKDARTEIQTRMQLARYLAVEGRAGVPDAQRRASEHLKLAATAAGVIDLADAQWRVRFLQGIVAENDGHSGEAIGLYVQAVARLDQLRAGLSQQEQRQAFMDNESIQELYRRLLTLLTAAGRHNEAWEYLERGKARAFLEMLQGRRFRSDSKPGGLEELEKLEKQIIGLRAQVSLGDETGVRGGNDPALVRTELSNLETRFAVVRQEAELTSSRAAQPLSLRPIALAELEKLLPAGSALVEYAVLDGALTAFIATHAGANQIRWTAPTKSLTETIRKLRDLMADPESGAELQPALAELSAILVAPVVKALPAGTERLLIVPAQAMNYIPFQALLLPDGRATIEQYTITYLPNASTLQFLKPAHRGGTDLFLGALGNIAVEGLPPLAGTVAETGAIAKLYPQAERRIEGAFTHDAAVDALRKHDEVHFATHGLYDEMSPLFSALLTGPAAGQPSRLSLYEVMDLRVRARLVVLSACETNRGTLMGGDEVVGLTRTFLTAGADTVVSSLWSVSDEVTTLLMQGFYRRLKTRAPAAAMRESALEVRKKYPHPSLWAPFVVTGAL